VRIEYGKFAGATTVAADQVVVAGTLTLDPSVRIAFAKFVDSGSWSSFVTPAPLELASVFSAGSILSGTSGFALTPAELEGMIFLEGTPLLSRVSATTLPSAGTLSFRIERLPYRTFVAPAGLQPLADYLFAASNTTPSTSLAAYLSVLDASVTAGELTAGVAALQSPVYAEAQRFSLRRTAAVSESVQGRLVRGTSGTEEGWAAWSESYGWSFNRNASGVAAAWQGRTLARFLVFRTPRQG
jgi:hypothetical protein